MSSTSKQLWENPIRVMLREGKPVLGVTITTNCVEVAVQTASLGFDFLWIEMEHSPINPETLRNIVLGTRGLAAIPFARVPVNEFWTAKRVMDAGVMGVIFPFTSTPELAKQAAAACKYPPVGRRGSGAGLASFRWPAPEDYYDFADRNMMVIAMIEEIAAVEQIDAIAATPGIDVLFIGASDLSFSMGLRGRQNDPGLEEAISRVATAAKRHQKFLGRPARNPDQLAKYVDQGFLFFQVASEIGLLAAGARQFLEPLGKRIDPAAGWLPY
jgi:2-keto-3-deoxy-L-rhamnonate aldolase RhmA